ncbi:MAG TPA: hypothetical protein VLN46_06930 [Gillisia sp.]|nr:hypothetical protein [Gillisia sp.]
MNKRLLLLGILIFSLLIPGLYILHLEGVFLDGSTQEEISRAISGYRLRVWLSWVIMIIIAIYNKWTTGSNNFFKMIYFLLIFIFSIEGVYIQRMVNMFDIPTNFQDTYSYGIFITSINIITAAALTAFLQLGVWWFTRKWHRE